LKDASCPTTGNLYLLGCLVDKVFVIAMERQRLKQSPSWSSLDQVAHFNLTELIAWKTQAALWPDQRGDLRSRISHGTLWAGFALWRPARTGAKLASAARLMRGQETIRHRAMRSDLPVIYLPAV